MIYVGECFAYIFLKSFIVSGLTFRSLIHFEFVYGVTKCSSFILLQVVDQFSQHHLLKRLSFLHLYILASFVKDKVYIGAWIYFWAFYFGTVRLYINSLFNLLKNCQTIFQSYFTLFYILISNVRGFQLFPYLCQYLLLPFWLQPL